MGCGSSALPANPMESLENVLSSIIKGKMPPDVLDSILNRDNVNTKVDVDDLKDVTPLIVAAKADKLAVVEGILLLQPDMTATDGDGNTALHIAVANGNAEMVHELIKAGSDVDSTNEAGHPILRTAILENETTDILEKLLEVGAKHDYTEPEPPLQTAAENEKLEAVQVLLKKKADPNGVQVKLPSGEEVDLLTWATKNEHSTILGLLALGGEAVPDLPDVPKDENSPENTEPAAILLPGEEPPIDTIITDTLKDDNSQREGGDGAEQPATVNEENDAQTAEEATPAPNPDTSSPAEAAEPPAPTN